MQPLHTVPDLSIVKMDGRECEYIYSSGGVSTLIYQGRVIHSPSTTEVEFVRKL